MKLPALRVTRNGKLTSDGTTSYMWNARSQFYGFIGGDFEIFGNRGIYKDGWFAGMIHRAPWEPRVRHPLLEDRWELYDTRNDFSLVNDLAAANAPKLKELQDPFIQEAIKYRVLPIDDRQLERANAAIAGRPDIMAGRTSLTLYEGMNGLTENTFINIKNRSFTIAADMTIPKGGANGVIVAPGGRFGGWSVYLKNGHPTFCYNFLGLTLSTIASPQVLAPGDAKILLDFLYDGGGLGKGGTATLSVNGVKVAQGRVDRTQPLVFSADETAGAGQDEATNVTPDYKEGDNAFTGKIVKVQIDVKAIGVADKTAAAGAIAEAARKMEAAK